MDNPGSGDVSYPIIPDTICDDWEFEGPNSTIRGRQWKNRLLCEQTSTAIDRKSNESDLYWFLCAFFFLLLFFFIKYNVIHFHFSLYFRFISLQIKITSPLSHSGNISTKDNQRLSLDRARYSIYQAPHQPCSRLFHIAVHCYLSF